MSGGSSGVEVHDVSTMDDEAAGPSLGGRAARASVALGGRQVAVALLGLAGAILIAREVSPAVFAVFAVSRSLFNVLCAGGDLGLAASLVRQRTAPTRSELRAVATVQVLITLVLSVALWWAGPALAASLSFPSGVDTVLRCTAVAVLLVALRATPQALLERSLRFGTIGAIDVAQAAAFTGTAVGLVYSGWGVPSFGAALVVQAGVGLVLTVAVQRLPGFTRDLTGTVARLSFGVPYFASTLVSALKDAVAPLVVGVVLGARDVGLVEWAVALATYPLFGIVVLQRVYLPVFARLQHDRERLGRAVESVVHATNLLVAPLAVLTAVLAPWATPVVFGSTWLPALPVFGFLWLANLVVATASPLAGLLNAMGRTRTVLRFSVLWMVATCVLTVPLVLGLGRVGFGVANALVQVSMVLFVRAARREATFRVLPVIWRSWATAVGAGALVLACAAVYPPRGIVPLVVQGAVGLLAYVGVTLRFQKVEVGRVRGLLQARSVTS